MRKILIALFLFLFSLPCFSMELKSFDILETFFTNKINSFEGRVYGDLHLKGVWYDSKGDSCRVLLEEIFCNIGTKECIASTTSVGFLGSTQFYPYLDTNIVMYTIVDYSNGVLKLYDSVSGYTVEINLRGKTATKYKVFSNGDVNRYTLLLDRNKALEYFKTIIPQ